MQNKFVTQINQEDVYTVIYKINQSFLYQKYYIVTSDYRLLISQYVANF